jgi:hypothetical protein
MIVSIMTTEYDVCAVPEPELEEKDTIHDCQEKMNLVISDSFEVGLVQSGPQPSWYGDPLYRIGRERLSYT